MHILLVDLEVHIQKWAFCHVLWLDGKFYVTAWTIWNCQISPAFDLIKRKWHVVKSNILKMLPRKKGTYCPALKECQLTVFIKVMLESTDFLNVFSLIISPSMF